MLGGGYVATLATANRKQLAFLKGCIYLSDIQNKIYRILDANFNRASEGLRTAEEFVRFIGDNEVLSSDLKLLRHDLTAVMSQLDRTELLSNRDTAGDLVRKSKHLRNTKELIRCGADRCFPAHAAIAAVH